MELIKDFLTSYRKAQDHYANAAKKCAERCEIVLKQNGIRAIVSHRAKREESLHLKLNARQRKKKYKTFNDIYSDIQDLAGVRIALYFPDDNIEVERLIQVSFRIEKSKRFPETKRRPRKSKLSYENRFSGYWAQHYTVRLNVDGSSDELQYKDTPIEIQVASVLMHAWAEVEHDLLYKPLTGDPSDAERAILDEINGLVMAGEIALGQLQTAVKQRFLQEEQSFSNHFELAAYLYDRLTKRD
jgi:ppGpp synthetase/RelA/SpoT-type nucleotidyltranferase